MKTNVKKVEKCAFTGKGANVLEVPNAISVMWAGKTSLLKNNNPQQRHLNHAVMVLSVALMLRAGAILATTSLTATTPRSRAPGRGKPGPVCSPTGAWGSRTGEGDKSPTGLVVDSAQNVTELSIARSSIAWRIFPCITTNKGSEEPSKTETTETSQHSK